MKTVGPFAVDCRDGGIVSLRPDLLYHTKYGTVRNLFWIGTVSIKEEKGRIVSRVTQPFGRVSIPSISSRGGGNERKFLERSRSFVWGVD